MKTKAYGIVLAVVAGWFGAAPAVACDVPVFRYALERWLPGPYEVLVFHRGALSGEGKKVADWLAERAADGNAPCNVEVRAVDVSAAMDEEAQELLKSLGDEPLPQLVVCFPRRYGPPTVAWSGPLAEAGALVDSPVRREIARRICRGDSAVWVLLEGGDKAKDDAAAILLEAELKRLASEIELPVPEAPPWGEADEGGPGAPANLKVAFSLVRMSRTSPAEQVFVHMLMHTEPDLTDKKYASEPMAMAVFGQGRALLALVGKGIHKDNIEEICAFLTGRCSCEVKEMNPGVDLPISADWSAAFEDDPQAAPELPAAIAAPVAAPAAGAGADADAAAGPPRPVAVAVEAPSASGPLLRNVLIAVAVLALAAAGLAFWLNRRPARS